MVELSFPDDSLVLQHGAGLTQRFQQFMALSF